MDESSNSQNRKNRRSNVLMSASLELSGTSVDRIGFRSRAPEP